MTERQAYTMRERENCYLTARCKDCNAPMDEEWYVVKKRVWEQAWPGTHMSSVKKMKCRHFLCIRCLEKRLKRKLTREDFDMRRRVNVDNYAMSDLFVKRIGIKPKPSSGLSLFI